MQKFVFQDVLVSCPEEMPLPEARGYVAEQLTIKPGCKLAELEIKLAGNEVVLAPHYDSIVRIRRITGYLSTISKFNDAKKDEERSRLKHICCDSACG